MRIWTILLAGAIAAGAGTAAEANQITLKFTNMSGQANVAMFATPKGENAAFEVNLVPSGEIAGPGRAMSPSPRATRPASTISRSSSATVERERPDEDLCQTDELIVE